MGRLSAEKLKALKKAYIESAMVPGQAAEKVGVTYATAKRYYDLWDNAIKWRSKTDSFRAFRNQSSRHKTQR
jgi:hypothetical protein